MNSKSKEFRGTAYSGYTSSDSKDLTKVLIGALAGAAAGSIIGGLFTEKGIEARRRVGESSKNIANNLKEKVSDIKEGITEKYEAVKESASDLIQKGKRKAGMSGGNTAYRGWAESDAKGSGTKVLLGALAVSVAGTVIWSFATEKGNQTRKRLGKNSKNIANTVKEKLSDIADGIADTYETAKEGAGDLLEKRNQQGDTPSGSTAYRGSAGADLWQG